VLNICSDGPERANLEELARTLRIDGRTRFLGAVSGLSTLYGRAALLLTGSVLEQYSLTIMEAYAFGVPCVGLRPDWKTVFNSNEDQIVEGVTGHVVQDESDMARRIDELLRALAPPCAAALRIASPTKNRSAPRNDGMAILPLLKATLTRVRWCARPQRR
jgi:glycosyltransferase involved in cell wall biosynthesis